MRLTFHVFAWCRSLRLTATQAPSSAHIWAHALCWAGTSHFDISAHSGTASLSALIRCSALALRVHSHLAARRQAFDGRDGLRSQPVRSASERRRPARHISVACGPCSAPRIFLGSLDRRVTMSTFDTLPGESNAHVISSIINLVCPQCGGRMSEFQCEGRCCRNWLAEWEWANQATRSPKSRRGHAGRSMR
jgi:hypothetical protein